MIIPLGTSYVMRVKNKTTGEAREWSVPDGLYPENPPGFERLPPEIRAQKAVEYWNSEAYYLWKKGSGQYFNPKRGNMDLVAVYRIEKTEIRTPENAG